MISQNHLPQCNRSQLLQILKINQTMTVQGVFVLEKWQDYSRNYCQFSNHVPSPWLFSQIIVYIPERGSWLKLHSLPDLYKPHSGWRVRVTFWLSRNECQFKTRDWWSLKVLIIPFTKCAVTWWKVSIPFGKFWEED